jgi:pSer/pThr/pTyr-binding forkhead associated (FHA) protein
MILVVRLTRSRTIGFGFVPGFLSMTARLVALDEGSDIMLDRAMVVVGRHPACDARLDSLRVSRHHCCMMQENGEVVVRDLGSTNGIRINGQRVEMGRLRPGDELSIAHIRYRLDNGQGHDQTLADPVGSVPSGPGGGSGVPPRPPKLDPKDEPFPPQSPPLGQLPSDENALAAAVRKILPSAVAEKCRIQVIVQMTGDKESNGESPVPASGVKGPENRPE